ncbi:ABC transporter permease [Streptomyces europaeiscabiei]|uniref:ABC transporter permease n=1 Tax=Streptomyces europaeiscabiei TaxID=146819 RepID=UPI002E0F6CD3|nr:ABC transporter permease [Streptomyces europaeiscabiei]
MTATTTPAAQASPAVGRGLVRTVLRLHRPALLVWGAYVLVMAGWMLWLRIVTLDEVWRESASCSRRGGCVDIESALTYGSGMSMIGTLVSYLCYGVAAWAGASLTGRELERGTAQLAWTQSVTPTRWLVVKLTVPAAVLVLGTTVLVLLYRSAWGASRSILGDEWDYPDPMVNRGPLLVAYALCALAVGALAGLALKRALPALAVALGFMVWFHLYLDRHIGDLRPINQPVGTRPPSHFWPLHLMATGIVLAVTVVATAAAFWLLRRRAR